MGEISKKPAGQLIENKMNHKKIEYAIQYQISKPERHLYFTFHQKWSNLGIKILVSVMGWAFKFNQCGKNKLFTTLYDWRINLVLQYLFSREALD
jgi:hypothetical protein